ncbi:MAG: magnesium/cobalt transporter CorA [Saprospiraceae bacterium]
MSKKVKKNKSKRGLPPGSLVYTGDRAHADVHLHTIWFDENEYKESSEYHLNWHTEESDGVTWIDVRSLNQIESIQKIGGDFKVHTLALEDVLNTQQRAKLEEYDNGLFIVLYNLHLSGDDAELQSEQIALFLGKNYVLSFQEDVDDTLASVRKRASDGYGRMRQRKADYLAYAILDTITDNYFLALDEIENRIQSIEDELHQNGATSSCKNQLFKLKRTLNTMRHFILPLRDAVNRLYTLDSPFIAELNRPYLRDVADHVSQMLDSMDNFRDLLYGAESLYQAEVSNKLNNVMRLLTVISTIFIPLSFLTGLYGMNFDNMPELHYKNGYFIILGIMIAMTLAMLVYFKRKRWI